MGQTRTFARQAADGATVDLLDYLDAAGLSVDEGDPSAVRYTYARLDAAGDVIWSEHGTVDPPGSPADLTGIDRP